MTTVAAILLNKWQSLPADMAVLASSAEWPTADSTALSRHQRQNALGTAKAAGVAIDTVCRAALRLKLTM